MASSSEEKTDLLHQVWAKRLSGMTVPAIAKEMGMGLESCHQLLREARLHFVASTLESVAEDRKEVLGRLDSMLQAMWDKAQDGDPKAVAAALAIEERRSKLLGLDAPIKSATDLTSGGEALKFTVTIPRVRRVDGDE